VLIIDDTWWKLLGPPSAVVTAVSIQDAYCNVAPLYSYVLDYTIIDWLMKLCAVVQSSTHGNLHEIFSVFCPVQQLGRKWFHM
jgi:hypothetical protein